MSVFTNPSRTMLLAEISPPQAPADPYQIITPIGDIMGVTPYSPPTTFYVGQQIYIPCQALNGVGPFTWAATGLPAGASIDPATGEITGTLTAQAFASATITATDLGNGSATVQQVLGFDVGAAFKLIGDIQPFTNNTTYQAGLFAVGFTGTLTWSITGAPIGVTIDSATGIVGGTPHDTTGVNFIVKISAADSGTGTTATKTFVLVNNAKPGSVAVKPNNTGLGNGNPTLQAGAFVQLYCSQIVSLLGGAPAGTAPVTFDDNGGTLPTWLKIDPGTGIISGNIPANGAVGTYSVTLNSTDINGAVASRTFNINVVAGINLVASAYKFVVGSATDPQGVTTLDYFAMFFGDGVDGDFVLDGTNAYPTFFTKVGFAYTLKRPLYANNLTIATGVNLNVAGMPVYVRGVLAFTGTTAKITTNNNSTYFGAGSSGGLGGTCTTTTGNPGGAASPAGVYPGSIGIAGNGGQGGTGTSGLGGSPGAANTSPTAVSSAAFPVRSPFQPLSYYNAWFNGGCAGGGGGGGGGNGTASLGVGGPGGDGGGVIQIFAYTIDTSGVTGTLPQINAGGGDGQAGTNSAVSGRGGGAGGGGGNGGIVWIVCVNRIGGAITDFLRVDGGAGGNPGTQVTLTVPTAGKGGGSGFAAMFVLGNNTVFEINIGAPSGGQSATLGRVTC